MSKKFNKIVCVDHTKIEPWALKNCRNIVKKKLQYIDDYPDSKKEILKGSGMQMPCWFPGIRNWMKRSLNNVPI